MAKQKVTPGSQACARLLDGAEDELQSIRAAFTAVSLDAASEKRAAEAARPIVPLRPKIAGEASTAPSADTTPASPRPTLMERLKTAAKA